jgi:hypothetical protein
MRIQAPLIEMTDERAEVAVAVVAAFKTMEAKRRLSTVHRSGGTERALPTRRVS